MGYLYGMKATAKETSLIRELREVPSAHRSPLFGFLSLVPAGNLRVVVRSRGLDCGA